MEKEENVSRTEFEKLAKEIDEVKEMLYTLHKESKEPKAMAMYYCDEEGCKYVTDDIGAYIEHVVDEKTKKLPSTEETPKRPTTIHEFLDYPDCFPQIEKLMLEQGWKKPELKPKEEKLFVLEI
jgi:hypothetical protein